jgi:argininosuccinate lyase
MTTHKTYNTFKVKHKRSLPYYCIVTVTELADALAREHGLSFRVGHAVAARVVALRRDDPGAPIAPIVERVTLELGGQTVTLSEEALADLLSPEHFVAVRRTLGGPSPDVVRRAIDESLALLAADEAAIAARRRALAEADCARASALSSL